MNIYCALDALVQFSSVIQSCPTLCDPMNCSTPGLLVHHQLLGVYSNSCSLSWWCHPTILSSVVPFSSCLQSFPRSGFFPMSQLFASVLPMNIQGLFPLRLIVLISSPSKGLWRVFSNTTVKKHQFFSVQPSLQSNSHICTWLLEKP